MVHLTDADRNTVGYDDLARTAACDICGEETQVAEYDALGITYELCADCADLFGWTEGEDR